MIVIFWENIRMFRTHELLNQRCFPHTKNIQLGHLVLTRLNIWFIIYNTGCFKKNGAVFILQISQQPSIGFSNCFFLLKTKIHMQILNTKPFLYNFRGLKNLQNKIGFLNKLLWFSVYFLWYILYNSLSFIFISILSVSHLPSL